jgi:hypothetical protein
MMYISCFGSFFCEKLEIYKMCIGFPMAEMQMVDLWTILNIKNNTFEISAKK